MAKKSDILISLGSLAITLLIVELVIRAFFPIDLGAPWRMDAPNAQPYLVNIPGGRVRHAFGDFTTEYKINDAGFRGPELEEGRQDIVFMGDSFTFGSFVDEPQTEVSAIREKVAQEFGDAKLQVINAAVAGSGLTDAIAYLEDYGALLNPKIIVMNVNYTSFSVAYHNPLYKLNCATRTLTRANPPHKDATKLPDAHHTRSLPAWKKFFYDHSQLVMMIRKKMQKMEAKRQKKAAEKLAATTGEKPVIQGEVNFESDNIDQQELGCFTEAVFKKMNQVAKSHGAALIVVDIGYRWQTQIPEQKSRDLLAMKMLPGILQQQAIPYLDLTDTILKAKEQGMSIDIPKNGHPTPQAHALMADTLWPMLKQKILEIKR